MNKVKLFIIILLTFFDVEASTDFRGSDTTWKAGVFSVIITPQKPMWMAGYASRVIGREVSRIDPLGRRLLGMVSVSGHTQKFRQTSD